MTSAFTTFGGMEYPQIVFSNPDRYTVAHELAHQWWWGIVGNDEFAEPWLDESLATWSQYLPFSPWRNAARSMAEPPARITNDMGYWRDHPGEYGTIYGGGGCMFADARPRDGRATRSSQALRGLRGRTGGSASPRPMTCARVLDAAAADAAPGLDMDAFWTSWRADLSRDAGSRWCAPRRTASRSGPFARGRQRWESATIAARLGEMPIFAGLLEEGARRPSRKVVREIDHEAGERDRGRG